jgi:hypothetical protein
MTALLDATDFGSVMQMSAPSTAMNVAMQSISSLVAAGSGIEHASTNTQVANVAQMIADALHGGGSGTADINALLNALPGAGGEANGALHGLASPVMDSVSSWDMGHAGSFTMDLASIMTHQTMVLHQDAVQPVANG